MAYRRRSARPARSRARTSYARPRRRVSSGRARRSYSRNSGTVRIVVQTAPQQAIADPWSAPAAAPRAARH